MAHCWELATRAWPGARQPRSLPAQPPAPTGAGARGARGGGAGVTLAARPAANGRAGRTRAARGARVSPRHGLSITRQSLARPRPAPAPSPGDEGGRPAVLPCHRAPRCHRAPAASSQGWGARGSPLWNGSPGASAPQFVPPAPSLLGPAPAGCPRCGLYSRRPPPVGGERRSRRGRRPPPLSVVGDGTGEHLVVRYAL